MSELEGGQRPPYEDVEPTRTLPKVVPAPAEQSAPQPRPPQPRPPQPPPSPVWTEARIMRLGSVAIGTVFVIFFVVYASRACSPAWAWAPFMVAALPYLAFYAIALERHLSDESKSRERSENWAHSRPDVTPLRSMPANVERYR